MSKNLLKKVLEERDAVASEAKNYLDAVEREGRSFTESDAEWTRLTTRLNDLDARAAELTEVIKSEAQTSEARQFMASLGGGKVAEKGDDCWLPGLAAYRDLRSEQRAVGTSGAFIPVASANSYFDLLRNRTAVLAASPVVLPVEGAGSIKVPKVTSSVTIAGISEGTAITPADPGLGEIVLDPKKFGALTLVNREAVEDSSPQLRQVVANSLVRDVAVEVDRQFLVGDGTGNNLRGLRNVVGVTAGPSTGTNGASLSFDHLADTLAAAEAANTDPEKLVWFMHSRTWSSVRKLKDSQNRPIVSIDPTSAVRPTLWGKPVYVSNSLPVNETKGTSTDTTSILLADMSQVVVAQARQIELLISEDYAFNADQVALRVTCRYDIGVPQPTAVTLTTGIRP